MSKEKILEYFSDINYAYNDCTRLETLKNMLNEFEEVVRCKECCYWDRETVRQNSNDFKWWNEAICKQHSLIGCNEPHEMWTDADFFCADGERKDGQSME